MHISSCLLLGAGCAAAGGTLCWHAQLCGRLLQHPLKPQQDAGERRPTGVDSTHTVEPEQHSRYLSMQGHYCHQHDDDAYPPDLHSTKEHVCVCVCCTSVQPAPPDRTEQGHAWTHLSSGFCAQHSSTSCLSSGLTPGTQGGRRPSCATLWPTSATGMPDARTATTAAAATTATAAACNVSKTQSLLVLPDDTPAKRSPSHISTGHGTAPEQACQRAGGSKAGWGFRF